MFTALTENGLGFLEKAAQELAEEPAHSVAHFATGLELVLKARLFREHWTLICEKPHSADWRGLQSGEVTTIRASQLLKTLGGTFGLLNSHQSAAFEKAIRHRNRVMHLRPTTNKEAISLEQCEAWYHLNALLLAPWKTFFEDFGAKILQVDDELHKNQVYLQAKYDQLRDTILRAPEANGTLRTCSVCSFRAAVIEEPELAVSGYSCRVCSWYGCVGTFACGEEFEWGEAPRHCGCGDHLFDAMVDEVRASTEPKPRQHKNDIVDERAWCYDCGLQTMAEVGSRVTKYVCLDCHMVWDAVEVCNGCGQSIAGKCQNYSGCVACSELWIRPED